mmetsp:Transcript_13254/g.20731  ORF Transcript_13254/g.20731 Transcript_13254/m.20731 type:complete len:102 (-) Transcript_13254:409-714(-)
MLENKSTGAYFNNPGGIIKEVASEDPDTKLPEIKAGVSPVYKNALEQSSVTLPKVAHKGRNVLLLKSSLNTSLDKANTSQDSGKGSILSVANSPYKFLKQA